MKKTGAKTLHPEHVIDKLKFVVVLASTWQTILKLYLNSQIIKNIFYRNSINKIPRKFNEVYFAINIGQCIKYQEMTWIKTFL